MHPGCHLSPSRRREESDHWENCIPLKKETGTEFIVDLDRWRMEEAKDRSGRCLFHSGEYSEEKRSGSDCSDLSGKVLRWIAL